MDSNQRVRIVGAHVGLLLLYALLAYTYYRIVNGPSVAVTVPFGGDFMNIWLAGKLVLQGQADIIYNADLYFKAQQAAFAENIEQHTFPYPPFFLPVTAPFGLLPYGMSYFVWCLGTFALYVWAMSTFGRKGIGVTLLLAAAPATFANFFAGQNGFLTAALFIGGLGLLQNRRYWAGVFFGLLTFKPHLGVLIPVALALRRQWRPFWVAGGVAVLIFSTGLVLFGLSILPQYLAATSFQHEVMEKGTGMFQMMTPSAFMAVRLLDGPLWLGYMLTALCALTSLAAVIVVWRRCENHDLRCAVLLIAALFAIPYALNYDMTIISAAVILLWPYLKARRDYIVMGMAWVLPVAVVILNLANMPLGPLVLLAALLVSVKCALENYSAAAK